jgi:hypothetical protein
LTQKGVGGQRHELREGNVLVYHLYQQFESIDEMRLISPHNGYKLLVLLQQNGGDEVMSDKVVVGSYDTVFDPLVDWKTVSKV